jgi:hypothetical protein
LASFDVDAFLWRFRCSVAADFKEKYPTPCKWSFIPNCMGNAFAPFERLLLAFGVDMASVNALVSMLEEIILRGGDDGPHAADNVLREYLREAQELLKAFVGGARSLTQFVGPGVNSAAGRAYTAFMESVVDKIKQQELLHIRGRSTSSSAHSKRGATPAHGGAASFLPSSSSSFFVVVHVVVVVAAKEAKNGCRRFERWQRWWQREFEAGVLSPQDRVRWWWQVCPNWKYVLQFERLLSRHRCSEQLLPSGVRLCGTAQKRQQTRMVSCWRQRPTRSPYHAV